VHRIGRTGRAGRSGEAILFVTPREKGMLRAIERATRQPIEEMKLPTVEAVNDQRIAKFKQRISDTLALGELDLFQQLIEQYEQEHNIPAVEIAAALARIAQGSQPLLLAPPPKREFTPREQGRERSREHGEHEGRTYERKHRDNDRDGAPRDFTPRPVRAHHTEEGKRTYRIEVGHEHGVKPGNIIGAIANEAGLESQFIGRLSIRGEYSLIDLPDGMPAEVFQHLQKVWVSQHQLRIKEWDGNDSGASEAPPRRQGGGGYRPGGGGFKKHGGGKPRPHGGHGGSKPPRRGK
jgi:ATP-dependent RNA helicase DeaD